MSDKNNLKGLLKAWKEIHDEALGELMSDENNLKGLLKAWKKIHDEALGDLVDQMPESPYVRKVQSGYIVEKDGREYAFESIASLTQFLEKELA